LMRTASNISQPLICYSYGHNTESLQVNDPIPHNGVVSARKHRCSNSLEYLLDPYTALVFHFEGNHAFPSIRMLYILVFSCQDYLHSILPHYRTVCIQGWLHK